MMVDEIKVRRFAFRKILLSMTALLFLLTASYCVCTDFDSFADRYTGRVEVNLNAGAQTGNSGLMKLEATKLLPNIFRNGTVSFSSCMDNYLKSGSYFAPVKAMLTDSSCVRFLGIEITRGTYFSEDAYKNGRNVTVISEKLAARLFTSLNAVGNEVELFNEKYTIVGLYRQKSNIVSLPGLDGSERVFIPFTSHVNSDSLDVDTLYISDQYVRDDKFRENYVKNTLERWLGLDTRPYRINDFYDAGTVLTQFEDILIFLAAIWSIWILGSFLIAFFRKNTGYIKSCLKDKYLAEFVKTGKLYISGFLSGTLLLIGAAVSIYIIAKPHIFIPVEYIPDNNIFDFAFYAGRVRSAIIAVNSAGGYIPTSLEKYYGSALMINTVILLCAVPMFFSLVSGIRLMKATGSSGLELLKAVAASCVLALTLSALFSLAGGVGLAIPLKNLVLLLAFVFLRSAEAGIWKVTRSLFYGHKKEVERIGP